MKNLIKLQSELKCGKSQFNKFGKYYYRSQEDVLEALKPLLLKHSLLLTITDEVREVAGMAFIEAIARVEDANDPNVFSESRGQAGIEKAAGMSLAQSFGSSSSYARKYALNGLFLIDDTKDADATNDHGKQHQPTPMAKPITGKKQKPELKPETEQWTKAIEFLVGIVAEMQEDIYTQIPEQLRDEMKVKTIDIPDAKELYRKDETWKDANKKVRESLDARAEIEARIRIKNK